MTQALQARLTVRPDPQKIIVPRRHGQILIEPALSELAIALEQRLSYRESVLGRSLDEWRSIAREEFVRRASHWAEQIDAPHPLANALSKPWVVTGHQLEFYHAGVWAKVLSADELAKRSGALAFDLLVDHDVVDQMGFDVPVQVGDTWQRRPVEWDSPTAVPAEGLAAPTIDQFEKWDAELGTYPQAQTDSLAFFLSNRSQDGMPYTAWMSQARSRFERAMNLHVHHIPTSLLCEGKAWQAFVQAWITNADAWTVIYNKHLATYRENQGIKNPQHPMPDLSRRGDAFELPFWIYKIGQPRERLFASKDTSVVSLLQSYVIRPRALALTMFTRLFIADLFIHGIGGALYDQITDNILHELFGLIPPYGCVSAAWLLPLGQPLESTDDIAALKWRHHHAAHNPQLAIDPFTALRTEIAEGIRDRKQLVTQLTESIAHARKDPAAKRERQTWFTQLHQLNESLHQQSPRVLANLGRQIEDALRAREQNKVLLWREYFFGLHAMESLRKLIAGIEQS